ncbi:hypothetical protein VPNG_04406 [Cytospora leucostoma]|uniref:Uncharacterized protein n=1 Tax=Cytospora leucostoma TaxID=1230097 RepID=A0A423XBS2_9PEZI|nr:hypothetical protein VPNG_04406 [Cytospora leucostoma]
MSKLSGSKRSAATAFTSPTKPASSKRSRAYYDYYDEEDAGSSPKAQWSDDEDMDSDSKMSIDGDDWLPLGDPADQGDLKKAPITKVDVRPPPATTTQCNCDVSNNDDLAACVSCACSRWGYRCKPASCGCRGGPSCSNPFNRLDVEAIFGPAPVILHPCFISWMLRQEGVRPEQITTRYLFVSFLDNSAFFEAIWSDYKRQAYRDWRAKWDDLRLPASEQHDNHGGRIALQQELLRLAFTATDLSRGVFFSLCHPAGWQDGSCTRHCALCGVCTDSREWHCGTCNECVYGNTPQCDGCGGVSRHRGSEWMELGTGDPLV